MKANAEHYVIFIISCLVWQVEIVLYLNQYAWWLIRLVIFHTLTGCFQFYFCGNPSLLKACSDRRGILLPPVHSAEAMVYVQDCKSGVGLGLLYPCMCSRNHCPAYRRCSDSMCQMNNTAGSWALGSSLLGCQQQPYLNHKKMVLLSQRQSCQHY